jgi:sigma54-dependent transcription regulator
MLAVARVLAMVSPEVHSIGLDRASSMVLQNRQMTWFRDVSLSGLSREFAETILFGIVPKGATAVDARIGVVEQAMTNADPRNHGLSHTELIEKAQERESWIPLITGGVVLLDEIGDAEEWLQLKLLRLLNGERVYRVQGEGYQKWSFVFQGMAILATWRDLDDPARIRPDLMQRIGQHRITVPGFSEYPVAARERIIVSIAANFQRNATQELERLEQLQGTKKTSESWLLKMSQWTRRELNHDQVTHLAGQDWSKFGEFRGVSGAVANLLSGMSMTQVFDNVRLALETGASMEKNEDDIGRLRRYFDSGLSLANGWKQDKNAWAVRMHRLLKEENPSLMNYLKGVKADRSRMAKDITNLMRSASGQLSGNGSS